MIEVNHLKTRIHTYLILVMLLLPAVLAKPSFFDQSNPDNDLKELDAMLSGEHRGINYGQDMNSLYEPPQMNSTLPSLSYDTPFKDLFLNDSIFGLFLREFQTEMMPHQINMTLNELHSSRYPYVETNASSLKFENDDHRFRPILVKEPNF
ncbi:MAG: hypothetical protein MUO26_00965 [Methanotrichaceae archaeon]|nr:hypothetical protein [Methanotrichaceae archaeon]